MSPVGDWEVVIGLEVHTHLRTASKLFSPAPVASPKRMAMRTASPLSTGNTPG